MASIRERRRADGSTTFAVLWRDADTGKQTSYQLPNQPEAERFKRLVEANGNSLSAVEGLLQQIQVEGPSVAENLVRHVELLTSAGPDQIKRYGAAISNHFNGKFGALPVGSITHIDLVQWIRTMQGKGLSAKTIANHHGLLSASFETAVRAGWRKDNPCKGVKLPKDASTEEKMRPMTAEESWKVTQAMPERYRGFVAFLRATGARFGEATAVRGGDFNFEGDTVTVRIERAWKRDGDNRFYIGPPKTRKSRRSISLPPSLVTEILPLIEKAGEAGYVFTTSYGGPIRHSTFHEFWAKALDSLGYDEGAGNRPRIHDLRHTHAALMLAGGLSIYELSRRLGHESINTTIDRYSDLLPDAHFRGAEVAAKALEWEPETKPLVLEAALA
ncbi:site-specific integrase [Arthrobacter jiangjiafuii]|uniref:Site-specific integrase n=1 Tax=Arthrobacter jiangjiafuii TaxID=2817475 RepID=A0A975M5L6_9MICC|nr:site-specific integrase [Arthrobacter jiangjiafuii]MBP3044902.1 site-specific integrase [Arthrobacter jiangjiafuii]QWC10275.1 site-specific integrase [Arthrobacter jiangjiafuii]